MHLAAVDNEEEIGWAKGLLNQLHGTGLHAAAPAVGVSFVRETDNATDESEEHGDDEKAAASAFRGGGKLLRPWRRFHGNARDAGRRQLRHGGQRDGRAIHSRAQRFARRSAR